MDEGSQSLIVNAKSIWKLESARSSRFECLYKILENTHTDVEMEVVENVVALETAIGVSRLHKKAAAYKDGRRRIQPSDNRAFVAVTDRMVVAARRGLDVMETPAPSRDLQVGGFGKADAIDQRHSIFLRCKQHVARCFARLLEVGNLWTVLSVTRLTDQYIHPWWRDADG